MGTNEPQAYGQFPFGQPNTVRPMRTPSKTARALVVGVYPSAFHIAWSPPAHLDPRPGHERRRPFIGSLAVDVEPVVFWDGITPSPTDQLARWTAAVGFTDAHGTATIGNNGPSGAGLVTNILQPLGLDDDEVAFTDAVPWFFVKEGSGSQGDAARTRFAPIAAAINAPLSTLPTRPTPRQLVRTADSEPRRTSLRRELVDSSAPLVITLGQEALDAVRSVADHCAGTQQRLASTDEYGTRGNLTIHGHQMQLLPLVHPGFQRQTKRPDWLQQLARWTAGAGHS